MIVYSNTLNHLSSFPHLLLIFSTKIIIELFKFIYGYTFFNHLLLVIQVLFKIKEMLVFVKFTRIRSLTINRFFPFLIFFSVYILMFIIIFILCLFRIFVLLLIFAKSNCRYFRLHLLLLIWLFNLVFFRLLRWLLLLIKILLLDCTSPPDSYKLILFNLLATSILTLFLLRSWWFFWFFENILLLRHLLLK